MKNLLSVLLFSGSFCLAAQADDIYYSLDFEDGLPQDVTLIDRDENPTKSAVGKLDLTAGSWAVAPVDRYNQAVYSSALCSYDYSVEDWLILPQINVKSSLAVLAWDAFSVHYDFREDYKVMISTSGNKTSDFVEVYTVTEEDYFSRRHAVSLAEYDGKDIYIAFVHTGKDKYLLGLDNIVVGEWYDDFALINHTDVSTTGGEDVEICGAIRNLSTSQSFNPILIVDGAEYPYFDADDEAYRHFATGEEVPFSFTVPTPEEGTVEYTLAVKNGDEIVWSDGDTVYCSAFPHNILVEEFTGSWCSNCPDGTLSMHKFQHRLRNRIIPIVGHCYPDPMVFENYHEGLNYFFSAIPGIIYDRRDVYKSQSAKDDGNIYKVMRQPVTAQVLSSVRYTADGKFEVNSTVRFAKEFDNTTDEYRMAYIITEDLVHVENSSSSYVQANSCQMIGKGEYYFLPSAIPASMMYYHNVARGTANAFSGEVNSLPNEVLLPGVDYQVVDTIEIPAAYDTEYTIDSRNISITTVVTRHRTRQVYNACRVNNSEFDWTEGVKSVADSRVSLQTVAVEGRVAVKGFDGSATVRLYASDGRLLDTVQGASQVELAAGGYRGVAVVAVETIEGVALEKVLIK